MIGPHLAIKRTGRAWTVDLVTPVPDQRDQRTSLARTLTKARAIEEGQRMAAQMRRPFKSGKASA